MLSRSCLLRGKKEGEKKKKFRFLILCFVFSFFFPSRQTIRALDRLDETLASENLESRSEDGSLADFDFDFVVDVVADLIFAVELSPS